ncbi:hypothetical protein [Aquipseudomonas alcaligenes]|uniref:hypothetical protein n=1 Tax=Aquipseudomonas alcaligenes TaxID=43263 RepID=UPI003748AED5
MRSALYGRPSTVDKDHALQNLRTSDNGSYIDFLRDHLSQQGIESLACDLGEEARGHRFALLLPHEQDAARAWQLLSSAPSEFDHHLQVAYEHDNRRIAFYRSPAVRRFSLGLLALLLAGMGLEALLTR